ncbi:MAG TPA: phenylacetate--CoA ligase [Candidatus Paceibacterota bacterium]|nr:phenylacetate--CoA ligase [Verrucomicrobiota bacterium]HOX03315.1 phenylacetate--CoA ligase [Verrucomicrobiota bacterium]HRZ46235.1 phenylacetate--CoA ligase [Candidatus Paceibacterota bacterium]HRZ93560.1 phenylacetate--CoA ligase [Candidatus Paceibacterota bacterium]
MNLYWNQRAETMSRDELAAWQSQCLKGLVERVYASSPFYRERFDRAGLEPGDIADADDLRQAPFIGKEDFRVAYPLGMLGVDRGRLREVHMSSGSTGTPVSMVYTEADLNQWAECMARCYRMAGLDQGNAIQITPSFGLFNGGFGFYHGARKAGMFVVPTGSGNTLRQIRMIRDFGVKGLMGVVSYGIRIMEVLQEQKLDLPSLEVGIFGAETFSDSLREKIENGLGIEAFDIYGMTETGGVGTTGMDCPSRCGIHVWEDHYIVEIVDPVTGRPRPDGETGEVVFTSLTREAMPIIRFRSGDLTRVLSRERCECGRTHLRLDRITGRVDDMLIIKGVNFFPRQVEQALMEIPGVLSHYQIIVEDYEGVRDLRVNVEAEPGVTGFMVEKHLKEKLGFSPKGDVFPPGGLPRTEGKAVRVLHAKGCPPA